MLLPHEGRSETVFAVCLTALICSFTFVALRVISRGAIVKKLQIDDYIIVVAWVIALGMTTAVCYGTRQGLGQVDSRILDEWRTPLAKADYTFSVLYNPALMAEKSSILIFYLTLSKTNRVFRWATIAVMTVVNAGGLALTLLTVFQCRPIHAAFTLFHLRGEKCTDIVTFYLSSAPLNIITDLAILFLPMPILTRMRLPRKQKIILIVTFSFGIFLTTVDVVRISYLQAASEMRLSAIESNTNTSGSASFEAPGFAWYASYSFMWSVIEVNLGIMCASVPALKPLASRFMPQMLRDPGDMTISGTRSRINTLMSLIRTNRAPSPLDEPRQAGLEGGCNEASPDEVVQGLDGSTDEADMYARVHNACVDAARNGDVIFPEEPSMLTFLTMPDDHAQSERLPMNRLATFRTTLTTTTIQPTTEAPTFFDFVDLTSKKSMVQMTARESIFPLAMVTVLFFIWGFEYGLLNVLNTQFQEVAHMTPGQTSAIHSSYYVGYAIGPWLVGHQVLRRWGFKACFSVGLTIYACGTLIFWPAAVLTSFPAYLLTTGLVGMGLSVLEMSANPFIALCGPPQYAEVRLCLSQGIQAMGTVIAPYVAEKAFLRKSLNAPSLVDTQYAYLGIALATVCLAVAYHYVPLPEATDADLDGMAVKLDGANDAKMSGVRIVWVVLAFCTFSQFCYVGAQEINGTMLASYLALVKPSFNSNSCAAIAHALFALSRFTAAGLSLFIRPRLLLLFFYAGLVLFQALAIHLHGTSGLSMLLLAFFMEGPIFPLLYAQSLRGMGRHSKFAAVVITSSISGGSLFSPFSNQIARTKQGPRGSLVVAASVFGAGLLTPFVLNASRRIQHVVDPKPDSAATGDEGGSRDSSASGVASKGLDFCSFGKGKGSRESTGDGRVEYRECLALGRQQQPHDHQASAESL